MQHCTRCCRPVRISIWILGCILMMPVSRRTICVRARQLWEHRSRFVLSMAHSVECLLGVKSSGLQKFRFQNSRALFGAAPLRSDTRAGVFERRPLCDGKCHVRMVSKRCQYRHSFVSVRSGITSSWPSCVSFSCPFSSSLHEPAWSWQSWWPCVACESQTRHDSLIRPFC
jgi:hypothetical protein